MYSATGQSWAVGLLASRVPVLFSCLTGKHLWLESHLVCSYQKMLNSFTEQAWKLLISPLTGQHVLTGTFVGGLSGLPEMVKENCL